MFGVIVEHSHGPLQKVHLFLGFLHYEGVSTIDVVSCVELYSNMEREMMLGVSSISYQTVL